RRNVAEQAADPDSVLNSYRRLLRLRRATPALQRGDQQLIAQADPDALVYVRQAPDSNAVVALNFGSRQVALAFPGAPGGGTWHVSFSTSRDSGGEVSSNEVLAPMEALVATACRPGRAPGTAESRCYDWPFSEIRFGRTWCRSNSCVARERGPLPGRLRPRRLPPRRKRCPRKPSPRSISFA